MLAGSDVVALEDKFIVPRRQPASSLPSGFPLHLFTAPFLLIADFLFADFTHVLRVCYRRRSPLCCHPTPVLATTTSRKGLDCQLARAPQPSIVIPRFTPQAPFILKDFISRYPP